MVDRNKVTDMAAYRWLAERSAPPQHVIDAARTLATWAAENDLGRNWTVYGIGPRPDAGRVGTLGRTIGTCPAESALIELLAELGASGV